MLNTIYDFTFKKFCCSDLSTRFGCAIKGYVRYPTPAPTPRNGGWEREPDGGKIIVSVGEKNHNFQPFFTSQISVYVRIA